MHAYQESRVRSDEMAIPKMRTLLLAVTVSEIWAELQSRSTTAQQRPAMSNSVLAL